MQGKVFPWGTSSRSSQCKGASQDEPTPSTDADGSRHLILRGLQRAFRAVSAVFQPLLELFDRWYIKLAVIIWATAAVASMLVNCWLLPYVNSNVLPQAAATVTTLLHREVSLGHIGWVSPGGLLGLCPLGSLGPVYVGPGDIEKSSVTAPEVLLSVDAWRSVVRKEVVLTAHIRQPDVTIVQLPNFSWFGHPEDTTPSARDYVPGLKQPAPGTNTAEASSPAAHLSAQHGLTSSNTVAATAQNHPISRLPLASITQPPPITPGGNNGADLAPVAAGSHTSPAGVDPADLPSAGSHTLPAGNSEADMAPAAAGSHTSPGPSTVTTSVSAATFGRHTPTDPLNTTVVTRADADDVHSGGAEPSQGAAHTTSHLTPLQLPDVSTMEPQGTSDPAGEGQVVVVATQDVNKITPAELDEIGVRCDAADGVAGDAPSGIQPSAAAAAAAVDGSPDITAAAPAAFADETVPVTGSMTQGDGTEWDVASVSDEQQLDERRMSGQHASTSLPDAAPPPAAQLQRYREGVRLFGRRLAARAPPAVLLPAAADLSTTELASPLTPSSSGLEAEGALDSDEASGGEGQEAAQAAADADLVLQPPGEERPAEPPLWRRLLLALWSRLAVHLHAPPVAIGHVTLDNASLSAFIVGEVVPRQALVQEARLEFGQEYRSLDVDVIGDLFERPSSSDKVTMASAEAKRHLRHVTAGAQLGRMRHFPCDVLPKELQGKQEWVEIESSQGPAAPRIAIVRPDLETVRVQKPKGGAQAGLDLQGQAQQAGGVAGKQLVLRTYRVLDLSQPQAAGAAEVHSHTTEEQSPAPEEPLQQQQADASAAALTEVQPGVPTAQAPPDVPAAHSDPAAAAQEEEGAGGGALVAQTSTVVAKGRPTGGHLKLKISAKHIGVPDRWPDLLFSIKGQNLHGPHVERIIELPMDIYEGRVDGELRIKCHDTASWQFPEIYGRVRVDNADLHFWDAPDDIHSAAMDLLFERDRMYLHGASGFFGAVPLTVTGDMDLNPESGTYRLSANVPAVEINALRATLGVRPIPFPLAGALRGVLHCTGPLEKPIFSGTAVATRPTAAVLAATEDSAARKALHNDPDAVAAYDNVPLHGVSGVFTLDLGTETLVLHSGQAVPAGGGQAVASGRMWVAPQAEADPRAVRVQFEAQGLDADHLMRQYLAPGTNLPPTLVVGRTSLKGTMEGSYLAPIIKVRANAADAQVNASAVFTQSAIQGSLKAPAVEASVSVLTSFPYMERAKMADTQTEATYFGRPLIEGVDLDLNLGGVDLAGQANAADWSASSQPMRLKVAGRAKMALRLDPDVRRATVARAAASAGARVYHDTGHGEGDILPTGPLSGQISIQGLRLNQMSLARQLSGSLRASPQRVEVHAKGLRPDEVLDLDVTLPQPPAEPQRSPQPQPVPQEASARAERALQGSSPEEVQPPAEPASSPHPTDEPQPEPGSHPPHKPQAQASEQPMEHSGDGATDEERQVPSPDPAPVAVHADVGTTTSAPNLDATSTSAQDVMAAHAPTAVSEAASTLPAPASMPSTALSRSAEPSGERLREERPESEGQVEAPSHGASQSTQAAGVPPATQQSRVPAAPAAEGAGGRLLLRRGPLLASGEVNGEGSKLALKVLNLRLDELELGGLRGMVGEASLDVDLTSRTGAALLNVDSPRCSGLQGESIMSSFRWEGDVVRLERAVLSQHNSRYEVEGEYVLPPGLALPTSAAALSLPESPDAALEAAMGAVQGTWRIQVDVPGAEIEEILPATQLLSSAAVRKPADYVSAKEHFLTDIQQAAVEAGDLRAQTSSSTAAGSGELLAAPGGSEARVSRRSSALAALPGLQDLRGHWRGTMQAHGSGTGAVSVDFDVRGEQWRWGEWALDALVASGSADSSEGLKLKEVSLRADQATLLMRGNLLGPSQDATLVLDDFPAALLHPVYRVLPALQKVGPAARAQRKGPGATTTPPGPFGAVTQRLESTLGNLYARVSRGSAMPSLDNSPICGQLFVKGKLGGSYSAPECQLQVKLVDGAVGPTQLARLQADVSLNAAQQLGMDVDVAPAEGHGYVRVHGRVALAASGKGGWAAAAGGTSTATDGGDGEQPVDVSLQVKDNGMTLMSVLAPDVRWLGGSASIGLRLRGAAPSTAALQGTASFSRASLSCPFLKHPVAGLSGTLRMDGATVSADHVEARVGARGHVRLKGALPLQPVSGPDSEGADESPRRPQQRPAGMTVEVSGLELKLRNMYSGCLDCLVALKGSLSAPAVSGSVRVSKGTAYLLPPHSAEQIAITSDLAQQDRDIVAKAFAALKAGRHRAGFSQKPEQVAEPVAVPSAMSAVQLEGLRIVLGPELRAMFPVVVNIGLAGEVSLTGPADPLLIVPTGEVRLEGGVVNFVATQFVLDRDHPNRIIFTAEPGLDPQLDLALTGADIRASVQGRASNWQNHVVLTSAGSGGGGRKEAEALDAAEVARMLEGRLAETLQDENGQLSFAALASSTVASLLPKIETHGQLGKARWRLVSAPSLPGLLSQGDASLLGSLAMGTEVEVQFGDSLQAAVAHKLTEAGTGMEWTLVYHISSQLRMQVHIKGAELVPTVMLQYSSEALPA